MYDYFFVLARPYMAKTTAVCTVLNGASMHGLKKRITQNHRRLEIRRPVWFTRSLTQWVCAL